MVTAAEHHAAWQGLPVGGLDDILGDGTALVLAPHPDDESLGCGGLIAAAVAAGRPPLVVVLTDGAMSHPGSVAFPADRLRAVRAEEVRAAVTCLGLPAEQLVLLGEPDGDAPQEGARFAAVVERVQGLLRAFPACRTVLAPWPFDPHCDHAAAARVAASLGVRWLAYPVWGWTLAADASVPGPVAGGWRLDVTAHLAAKQQAIRAHRSQYGGLISDDPAGFELPETLLSVFGRPYETFLLP